MKGIRMLCPQVSPSTMGMSTVLILLFLTGFSECVRSVRNHNDVIKPQSCVCVRVNRLNARENPSLESTVLRVLNKDTCFTFGERSAQTNGLTWWNLRTSNTANSQDMWVAARYMEPSSGNREGCTAGGRSHGQSSPESTVSSSTSREGSAGEQGDQCPGIAMVSREEWHARPPKHVEQMPVPVDLVFIHHTAMSPCSTLPSCSAEMRVIQNFHMDDRGWDDIGYNFLVGGDGRVYVGRGWNRVGAHTKGYNDKSIAISFMGNYMIVPPTDRMLTVAQELIQCGVNQGYVSGNYSLHGHRDVRCTDCPGDGLYRIIEGWPHWHREVLQSPVCSSPGK